MGALSWHYQGTSDLQAYFVNTSTAGLPLCCRRRAEIRAGNTSLISRQLAAETDRTLKRGEQVIMFLNRRGFSTQILCPDCGFRMTCPDCGISLTYHKSVNAAVCHYCGRKFALPEKCPDCGSKFIRYTGAGTEKVEETVKNLWPEAKTARFDLDTALYPLT